MTLISLCLATLASIVPAGDSHVEIRGHVGSVAEEFLEHRVFSQEAQGNIFDETENAFKTCYDGSHPNAQHPEWTYWQGEYWGKTMLGYAGAYRMYRNPEIKAFIVRKCHDLINQFQRPDGTISTYANEREVKNSWNLWGRKYTLWALLESYEITGERFILEAATRLMDQQIAMLNDMKLELHETGAFMGMPSCSVLRPLLILHRHTGAPRFLTYAKRIVSAWETSGGNNPGLICNAMSDKFVHEWFPHPEDWAKAYEMMSCYEGLIEYARVTGEVRPLEAARRYAEKLCARELNAVWSVGYYDHFEECAAYPNATSEICDVIHWNFLLGELYRETGEDRWLDLFEKSFFNAFLAGVYPREGWGSHGVRSHGRSHQVCTYEAKMMYHSCCVDNAPRGFYNYAAFSAATRPDGAVDLNFYTDARIRLDRLTLEISGNYPISDRIVVKARAACPTRLRLRVPDWCDEMSVSSPSRRCGNRLELDLAKGETTLGVSFAMPARILQTKLVGKGCPNKDHVRFMFELRDLENVGTLRTSPAARIMRGPLLMTKAKIVNTTDAEVFDFTSINETEGWKATLQPEPSDKTWGKWRLTLDKAGEKARAIPVCDYPSAANFHNPRNAFSIWF